jgi:hypothetical protein
MLIGTRVVNAAIQNSSKRNNQVYRYLKMPERQAKALEKGKAREMA